MPLPSRLSSFMFAYSDQVCRPEEAEPDHQTGITILFSLCPSACNQVCLITATDDDDDNDEVNFCCIIIDCIKNERHETVSKAKRC